MVVVVVVVVLSLVWIAFVIGLLVGWAWKPNWVWLKGDNFSRCISKFSETEARNPIKDTEPPVSSIQLEDCSSSLVNEVESHVARLVTEEDLKSLYLLAEAKDGGPSWIQMMDCTNATMSYQAWRRQPKGGPPQYHSRTVFENASPEIVRDFLWDIDFRIQSKWDDMIVNYNIVDECSATGTMLVRWIRKYPFFCSDREYIAGRRIWDSNQTYYCVTKGVPCLSIPRRDKPRRVDLYFSSWRVRAVESRSEDGQLNACEVLLFHYEEMGIPWEIAKICIRQGMWGMVKKTEPGLRAYQKARISGAELSRPAYMAQINTKISPELLTSMEEEIKETSVAEVAAVTEKPSGANIPKLLIIGGVIVVVCSINGGFLTKAVICGIGSRFRNKGKKL